MSSQVTRSQVKENGDGVSLTPRWFILNSKVKPTKFICSADSISRRDMVPNLSMNIYDSEHCNVTHPTLVYKYSIIHRVRKNNLIINTRLL